MNPEMKSSRFNHFFSFENKHVGYNALSDEFTLIEPELLELYRSAQHHGNWSELQHIHPDFYAYLTDKGFIVPVQTDEVQLVKDLVHKIDQQDDTFFQLTINPTMNCNFKCWYCYETHIKKSKMSPDTIQSIVRFIDNLLQEKKELKRFHLQWFGGEPLLYFDTTVAALLQSIYPKMVQHNIAFSSGFTTNGFLINQQMLDICKDNGVGFFQITLDGHRERHNQVRNVSKERGSYDEIVRNIHLCVKNGFKVSVRINVSRETLDNNILAIMADFQELNSQERAHINFSFHEVWQEEKNISRDIQHVVNTFRENNFNTLYKGVNQDTVRNSCYADKKNFATFNYNGEVFKCTARDFESASKEGILTEDGRLIWNEKHERRMSAKFQNPPCLSCSILPICNGGCSQHAMEMAGKEYCIHNYDENEKLDLIKDKFMYIVSNIR